MTRILIVAIAGLLASSIAARSADDLAAENIFEPRRGRFRIGTAQMDMVPRD